MRRPPATVIAGPAEGYSYSSYGLIIMMELSKSTILESYLPATTFGAPASATAGTSVGELLRSGIRTGGAVCIVTGCLGPVRVASMQLPPYGSALLRKYAYLTSLLATSASELTAVWILAQWDGWHVCWALAASIA